MVGCSIMFIETGDKTLSGIFTETSPVRPTERKDTLDPSLSATSQPQVHDMALFSLLQQGVRADINDLPLLHGTESLQTRAKYQYVIVF